MPQNDFVPWATGAGANVYSVASYTANPARQTGVVDGEADPQLANNAWRQPTVIASMIGQFIAAAGYDALDNGNLTTLLVNFQAAVTALAQSGAPGSTSLVHSGPDTSSTPNQIVISTVTPSVGSLADYQIYEVVPANSITGATSLQIGTLPALPLLRRDGGSFANGDGLAGSPFLAVKLGNAFRRLSSAPSEISTAATTVINNKRIVGGVPTNYSTGTYTVPVAANTTFSVLVRGGGGGGGGCFGSGAGASGGGGGGYAFKVATATVDTVLSVVVGAGGGAGAASNPPTGGTAGGTTSITIQSGSVVDKAGTVFNSGQTLCAATGGGGGAGGNGALQQQFYGNGGVGSGGDINRSGDAGGFPYSVGTGVIGGSGGASPYSGSSPGPNLSAAGNTSTAAGVGGNGDSGAKGGGPGSPGEATISQ